MLRRVSTGVAISIATLVALALGLEAGLRLLRIGDDAIAGPHPWTGWIHLPNLRADLASEDPAERRRLRFETNALGLRDQPREIEKQPGTYRVLLLGDSFVAGAQVPVDRSVSSVTQHRLAGRAIEIWNCGVTGYSTAQELLFLRHVARDWQPDLVVLAFFAANDVADNVAPLATSLRNRPFFLLRGDSLVLDREQLHPDRGPVAWLRTNSRAFGWVTTQIRTVRQRMVERRNVRTEGGDVPPALMIYAEQPDSLWESAWRLTERLILEVRDEARRMGADFALLSIPSGAQVHAEARANRPGWERWGELPGLSLEAPERRLAALAAAESLRYVPLLDDFRAEAVRTGAPLYVNWSRHWNERGHALAAGALDRAVIQRERPPGRPDGRSEISSP